MIAGPSEILVLSDGDSDPRFVAADLLSQAEHDTRAAAVLVTDSPALAEAVAAELARQVRLLPRREIAETSLRNNGRIIVTDSLDNAAEAANRIAPEHLELCVADPFAFLPRIRTPEACSLAGTPRRPWGITLPAPTTPCLPTARRGSPAP